MVDVAAVVHALIVVVVAVAVMAGDELYICIHTCALVFLQEPFYVFERCDVVAMPSFLEGLPNVLLEAIVEAAIVVSGVSMASAC